VRDCDAALGPLRPTAPGPEGAAWPPEQRFVGLRLNEYAEAARRFVWSELADWYLEAAKGRLLGDSDDREVARAVLAHAFDRALRLLHPIVPFITEALWQRLPDRAEGELLARAAWPAAAGVESGIAALAAEFELVKLAVSELRALRSEYNVPPGKVIDAVVVPGSGDVDGRRLDARAVFTAEAATIGRLARTTIRVQDEAPTEAAAHAVLPGGTSLVLPLAGLVDVAKECARLRGELASLEKQLGALEGRLSNEGFTSRAPEHVVEAERRKREEWRTRREQLASKVRQLCGD
jgi:valyl-tRNA synthetase